MDAILSADPSIVAPGRGVTINGNGFSRDAVIGLQVRGSAARIDLGQANVDPAGGFHIVVEIPASLPLGAYELVAVDADGDPVIGVLQLDASATGGLAIDHGLPGPWIAGVAALAGAAVVGLLRYAGSGRRSARR